MLSQASECEKSIPLTLPFLLDTVHVDQGLSGAGKGHPCSPASVVLQQSFLDF